MSEHLEALIGELSVLVDHDNPNDRNIKLGMYGFCILALAILDMEASK